jgi:hypothetical protein
MNIWNLKTWTVIVTLSTATFGHAATSGTLNLTGTVDEVVSIEVTAESVASNLDLESDQTDLKVATVEENSNSSTGYTVSIDSANSGTLVRTGGSETFSYSMEYDGDTVDLTSTDTFSNSSAASVSVNKDVTISYTGEDASSMVAGDYEDTVTFSIAAN